MQVEVVEVTAGPGLHAVRLANSDRHEAVALILGVGGTASKLGVPGEGDYLGRGVSYCGTCDGFFFRDRTVVVVGGGDTAVEEALHLSRLAKKVFLVHRGSTLRAARLVPPEVRTDEQGFVMTDDTCETSVPGIFAIGDLRRKFANQIVIAAADGSIAALAAAHYVEAKKTADLSSDPVLRVGSGKR